MKTTNFGWVLFFAFVSLPFAFGGVRSSLLSWTSVHLSIFTQCAGVGCVSLCFFYFDFDLNLDLGVRCLSRWIATKMKIIGQNESDLILVLFSLLFFFFSKQKPHRNKTNIEVVEETITADGEDEENNQKPSNSNNAKTDQTIFESASCKAMIMIVDLKKKKFANF